MYYCAAYIPDMSCEDSKRARHRQRQAAYEARLRERHSGGTPARPEPALASVMPGGEPFL
jgi:hypothetical protein